MFFVKLLVMIVLGLLSAALSLHRKNYYLRIFDDILGRDEDDKPAVKAGRAFIYGFLFPVYFALVLLGLIVLAAFLVIAGIIAAIIFVLVWITEKIIPHETVGDVVLGFLSKIGVSASAPMPQAMPSDAPVMPPLQARPSAPPSDTAAKPEPAPEEAKPSPSGGINVTRQHKLD
jgi:hypothetical protein